MAVAAIYTGGVTDFASRIIAWQRSHGRHGLPWQDTRDAYRIWLSEIMLQQTQVSTVIPYFEKFLAHFPSVAALASAADDEVMSLWSGLGYYARARNLHRAAKEVVARFGGAFPTTFDDLVTLPGIGRSTAAAIAASRAKSNGSTAGSASAPCGVPSATAAGCMVKPAR